MSGTIEVATGTGFDGDVNDPSAPYVSNDTLAAAQDLPNPVTLGGYVNRPGQGMAGRSFTNGDPRDYYRIALAAGQTIRLLIASDGFLDDVDLALLRLDGSEVAASDGITPMEQITVPESGDFLIEVLAASGASNYVLSVGQMSAQATPPPPEPEFVPGEVIVRFGGFPLRVSTAERMQTAGARMRTTDGKQSPETLVGCDDPGDLSLAFRALDAEHMYDDSALHRLPAAEHMKRSTRRLAKALRKRPDVVSADLNYIRRPTAVPGDEFFPLQWHYPQINVERAWDNVPPVSGVVVAVIDTGIVFGHPDLQGQLVTGYDFVQDPTSAADGNGCDADPTDPGDGLTATTSSFHGTHVAGTIAARTSLQAGGDDVGVSGVAWNARVMPLRALGRGGGTDFDVMQAIRYAAGLSNACNVLPVQPADVINLSLGGTGESAAFQALVDEVRLAGVTLVGAAGNGSTNAPFYPAAYDGVISVSATDLAGELASYSNFGTGIDVTAPGGDLAADRNGDGYGDGVLSTVFVPGADDNGFVYGFAAGTSMAAPHVSGVIALMLSINPNLNPFDIDSLLAAGDLTEDLGTPLFYGRGMIDAFSAISAAFEAQGGSPPIDNPRLRVSPSGLNFGTVGTQTEVDASNGGGDDLTLTLANVSAVTDDGAGWLVVSPDSVDAENLGRYTVSVDRSGLANGTYTGRVVFDSNFNDIEIPVIMQVGGNPASVGAGQLFILLIDPDSFETVQGLSLTSSNGFYTYRFDGVPPGEYLLVAGSDFDNDVFICDGGEACGSYPTLDQPLRLEVDRNRTSTDFQAGFGASLSAASTGSGRPGYARSTGKRLQRR